MAPEIRVLFMGHKEEFSRPRIPIMERALNARLDQRISSNMAMNFFGQNRFRLAGNQFEAEVRGDLVDQEVFSSALSHFGSIFNNAFVYLEIKGLFKSSLTFSVQAYKPHARKEWNTIQFFRENYTLGEMSFFVNFKAGTIFLYDINSRRKDYGGALCAALYNLGRDMEMQRIDFNVNSGNANAKRFYYHIDFGKPQGIAWNLKKTSVESWSLDIT